MFPYIYMFNSLFIALLLFQIIKTVTIIYVESKKTKQNSVTENRLVVPEAGGKGGEMGEGDKKL